MINLTGIISAAKAAYQALEKEIERQFIAYLDEIEERERQPSDIARLARRYTFQWPRREVYTWRGKPVLEVRPNEDPLRFGYIVTPFTNGIDPALARALASGPSYDNFDPSI